MTNHDHVWCFKKRFEVEWGDQDANNHVNNVVFSSNTIDVKDISKIFRMVSRNKISFLS